MLDDEIDNMDEFIRAASNSYHPAYDDDAWDKMEVLLDKHLPQKEDRKRPVFFFTLFLLTIGIATSSMLYLWYKNKPQPAEKMAGLPTENLQQTLPENATENTVIPQVVQSKNNRSQALRLLSDRSENTDAAMHFSQSHLNSIVAGKSKINSHVLAASADDFDDENNAIENKKFLQDTTVQATMNEDLKPPLLISDELQKVPLNSGLLLIAKDSAATQKTAVTVKSKSIPTARILPNKLLNGRRNKNGFANNFGISFSAGPDFSFVALTNPGKTRLSYGAGISYTFLNRLSVQTGFYVAQKVYAAKSTDYHPPTGYWTYNTDLKRVDGSCKIFEIPLTVDYTFSNTKRHSWMAGLGVSSLLMKSETYNYLYKNMQGQTLYKGWTLRNKNKHFFSMLTISGGYQYAVSKHLSIIAAPYFQLSLHGIGFGKIKLNSGGLMVTASIKPFATK